MAMKPPTRRKMFANFGSCATTFLLLNVFSCAAQAQDTDARVIAVANHFVHAQSTFDVPTLKALTDDTYIEVSPIGDVDPRDKMLGFYAPENKMDGVTESLDETSARIYGDTAVVIGLIQFSYPGKDGKPIPNTMRGTFVERKFAGTWKLVSTQFTGYRPPGK